MSETQGLNHLDLFVPNLETSMIFLIEISLVVMLLTQEQQSLMASCLTLSQIDQSLAREAFNRKNVGLHYLA